MKRKQREYTFWAVVVLLALPKHASAYLDPGSGSMVLQMAIGGLLAAIATTRFYWKKVKLKF